MGRSRGAAKSSGEKAFDVLGSAATVLGGSFSITVQNAPVARRNAGKA
jgi:hypothetical protein